MKKYVRSQEKESIKNIFKEHIHFVQSENLEFEKYCIEMEWRNIPFDNCNCDKCIFIKTLHLKFKLWEKHKNKLTIYTLKERLFI